MDYRSYFPTPPAKPILTNAGRPSVLNRSAELDDILEEDREADGDDENEGSPSPAAISSPSTHSPEGSFRFSNKIILLFFPINIVDSLESGCLGVHL